MQSDNVKPEKLLGQMIKLLDDDGITTLIKLFNMIYETGQIPQDWLCSVFITIPNKENANKCDQLRLKLFLKIIQAIIRLKCEDIIPCQFGFRQGFGKRDTF